MASVRPSPFADTVRCEQPTTRQVELQDRGAQDKKNEICAGGFLLFFAGEKFIIHRGRLQVISDKSKSYTKYELVDTKK